MYGQRNLAREKDDFRTRYLWRAGNIFVKQSALGAWACVRATLRWRLYCMNAGVLTITLWRWAGRVKRDGAVDYDGYVTSCRA
jgi:hypothetical protein